MVKTPIFGPYLENLWTLNFTLMSPPLPVAYMWDLGHKQGWAPKNDAFELQCWGRLLSVLLTAWGSNRSSLKEANPECSLGRLMRKLKFQFLATGWWGADWLEKTLMLRKTEGRRRRGQQRARWPDGITSSTDGNLSKLQEAATATRSRILAWRTPQTEKSGRLQSRGSDTQQLNHNSILRALRSRHLNPSLTTPTNGKFYTEPKSKT